MRGERVPAVFAGGSLVTLAGLVLALVLFGAGSASAATPAPAAGWTIESFAAPTDFSPSAGGGYTVTARNAGSVASNGEAVTLTDALPQGLQLGHVEFSSERPGEEREDLDSDCTSVPLQCTFTGPVEPDQT